MQTKTTVCLVFDKPPLSSPHKLVYVHRCALNLYVCLSTLHACLNAGIEWRGSWDRERKRTKLNSSLHVFVWSFCIMREASYIKRKLQIKSRQLEKLQCCGLTLVLQGLHERQPSYERVCEISSWDHRLCLHLPRCTSATGTFINSTCLFVSRDVLAFIFLWFIYFRYRYQQGRTGIWCLVLLKRSSKISV